VIASSAHWHQHQRHLIDGDDIFRDGVNVAGRLEALCEPGGVTISRAADEQIRDKLSFAFADLGERTVRTSSAASACSVYPRTTSRCF
jgi:class 3 adenylate cyclase